MHRRLAGEPVPATTSLHGAEGVRLDVLGLSRQGEGRGTLLQARVVDGSAPDGPAGFPTGEANVCNVRLLDTATLRSYDPARPEGEYAPCAATLLYAEGPADGSASTSRQDDHVAVTLAAGVLFAFDSAEPAPEATARLDELATEVAEQATAGPVAITGHTDDVGDEAYNQQLPEQRAEAVRAVLEPAIGRDDPTFEVAGRGESEPVARNTIDGVPNPGGQARNRRVTIVYAPN